MTFQYLKRAYKKDGEGVFTRVCSDRTGGNSFKLKKSRFKLDIWKKFLAMNMARTWNEFPREAINPLSLCIGLTWQGFHSKRLQGWLQKGSTGAKAESMSSVVCTSFRNIFRIKQAVQAPGRG